jgi:hypothetical protein
MPGGDTIESAPGGETDMPSASGLTRLSPIGSAILTIRGQKVILDSDLAAIYGVPARRLNKQVERNQERFPTDITFQITLQKAGNLKSQFAVSSSESIRSHSVAGSARAMRSHAATASKRDMHFLDLVFTEHGDIMAAM